MDLSIQLKLDSAAFDAALASARQSLAQLKAAAAPQDLAAAQDAAASLAQSLAGIRGPELATDASPLAAAQDAAASLAQQLAGIRGPELATDAAPLAAAQDAAASLAQSLAGIQPLDMAVDNTPLREAAEAAQQLAGRVREVAEAHRSAGQAAKDHAAASGGTAASNQDLAAALKQAHGGMGVMSGAASMASGSLVGMAGGAVQAANGMRLLGVSLKAAMDATLVLALAAAIYQLVQKIRSAREEAERLAEAFAKDNLSLAIDAAATRFDILAGKIDEAAAKLRSLGGAMDLSRQLEQARQLAELERDRAKALAQGGDADAINREFDTRRRALAASHAGENRAVETGRLEAERESLHERIALEKQRADELNRLSHQAGESDPSRQSSLVKQVVEAERRIRELEAEEAAVTIKIEAQGTREAIAALEEETAALDDAAKAAQKLEEQKQTALREAAEAATRAWQAANAELERSIDLTRGLGGAAAEASRIERDRQLAELERDRQKALSEGGDSDAINREFDERRRTLEFTFEREDSAGAAAALRQEVADNEKRIVSLEEALTAAEKAQEADKIASLQDQIAKLENRNQVLSARAEAEEGRAAVIDLREEAATLAAETAAAAAAAARGGEGAASGISGALQIQTDRLTRIGGFTGGGAPSGRQDEALREARRSRELLERIARAAEKPGGTVLRLV